MAILMRTVVSLQHHLCSKQQPRKKIFLVQGEKRRGYRRPSQRHSTYQRMKYSKIQKQVKLGVATLEVLSSSFPDIDIEAYIIFLSF